MKVIESCRVMYPYTRVPILLKHAVWSKEYRKVIVFMHGSQGFGKVTLFYLRLLAQLGFLVIAPDHVTSHVQCLDMISYKSTIQKACSTKNQNTYRYIVQYRLMEIRKCMHFIETHMPHATVSLAGTSEGAIAVARSRANVHSKLLLSYVAQPSYFSPQMKLLHVKEGSSVVIIHGANDEYFGSTNSVSSQTKHKCGGKGHVYKHKSAIHTHILKNTGHNITPTQEHRNVITHIVTKHFGCT